MPRSRCRSIWSREPDDDADEIELDLSPSRTSAGSELFRQRAVRTLITVSQPEQGWDRYKDTCSTIAEPGYFTTRVAALEGLVNDQALAQPESGLDPGHTVHCTIRQHRAGRTIDGKAVPQAFSHSSSRTILQAAGKGLEMLHSFASARRHP